MSDLDDVIPPTMVVRVGNEAVEVRPLRVGQLPGFVRALGPLIERANEAFDDPTRLVMESPEEIAAATAIALGKPRGWIDGLELDQMAELVGAVITVNADFFLRRVAPKVQAAAAQIRAALGPMFSSGLSAPVTDGTTS